MLAGKAYGIPVRGTHAHSWIMSQESELTAFRKYVEVFPRSPILLIDTYDTLKSGLPNAIQVFKELRALEPGVRAAIRLDSGDLARLSKEAYRRFAAEGFADPLIVGSGDLDEDLIADLKRQGAKINSWGVGTNLITGKNYPALGGVYKVVAMQEHGEWTPRIKVSSNPAKTTDPGRKQVFRLFNGQDVPLADVLGRAEDRLLPGRIKAVDRLLFYEEQTFEAARVEPLLERVMRKGKRLRPPPALEAVRERAQQGIRALPEEKKRLRNPDRYPVLLSHELAEVKERLLKQERKNRARKPALQGGGK
jgi:nicotinate phosphoribosyltransferase